MFNPAHNEQLASLTLCGYCLRTIHDSCTWHYKSRPSVEGLHQGIFVHESFFSIAIYALWITLAKKLLNLDTKDTKSQLYNEQNLQSVFIFLLPLSCDMSICLSNFRFSVWFQCSLIVISGCFLYFSHLMWLWINHYPVDNAIGLRTTYRSTG